MAEIRIVIADDHPLFRQGLRRILDSEEDLYIEREVGDGREALEAAKELLPDIILMDVNLPSMNGLQVTREIKSYMPSISVIILTAYDDDQQLFHSIRAGASAYYSKDVEPKRIVETIRQVSRGNYVINDEVMARPQVATWLLKEFDGLSDVHEAPGGLFVPLSPREMEVLELIVRGKSNKEIARQLGISSQTVKNHLSSILRKLAVNDRTQAAVYALRRGWIRLEDAEDKGEREG